MARQETAASPVLARTGAPCRRLVVVCPTEYGGQIEHAGELANAALAGGHYGNAEVVTRPGGAKALVGFRHDFGVTEALSPRRTERNRARAVVQFIDAWRDRLRLRALIRDQASRGPVDVLYETSKYGVISRTGADRHVFFAHNAAPHALKPSARDRYLFRQERRAAASADLTVVHGKRQADAVSEWTRSPVRVVPLPGDSRLQEPGPGAAEPYALCLGEIRPNKGVEAAISAARTAGVRLLVRGKPEPQEYGASISALAGPEVDVSLGFVEAETFSNLLANARVVLLPYVSFSAQSGILAKAIQMRRRVIASDLASLREQAGDDPRVSFVRPGDVEALTKALSAALSEREYLDDSVGTDACEAWIRVADVIFAT
ncbi:glycosyltransferase [Microbacterium sp. LWH3-1.2]|uniref:glycosyltransferase n=1 Tax=Microbacterium sp. LWH3-1.2 TaxID=3135256 RepID=UPI00341F5AE9